MSSWFYFAIGAMLLFSFSSVALKLASEKYDFLEAGKQLFLPLALGVVVFLATALFLANNHTISLPSNFAMLAVAALVAALIGFVLFLNALQSGKVAVITAVLSLGTIVIAFISNHFLGVNFTLKEVAAIALAVVSVSLFVL